MATAYSIDWQKSSYSASASNCVELAASAGGTTHLRESEDPATVLTTTPVRLRALLALARSETRMS